MFVFGVVIPTLITILVFVGFLICWFKFNLHERFFNKKQKLLTQPNKDLPPHLPVNGPHKIVHFQKDEEDCSKDNTGDEDKEDDNDGNEANTVSTEGEQSSPKNLEPADEGSICDDVETALCISENCQNEEIEGFSNPNMCMCSSPSEIRTEVIKIDNMVQHTFHFPVSDCTQLSGLAVDSEDSEDGNYGHFVPLSQALKDPKTRQMFEAAVKLGVDPTTLSDTPTSSTSSSPIKHKKVTELPNGHLTTQRDSGHLIAGK